MTGEEISQKHRQQTRYQASQKMVPEDGKHFQKYRSFRITSDSTFIPTEKTEGKRWSASLLSPMITLPCGKEVVY